jgi:hypothetical protein
MGGNRIQWIQMGTMGQEASQISWNWQRKTGQTSKVLEMRLFYRLRVTVEFAKNRAFLKFINVWV